MTTYYVLFCQSVGFPESNVTEMENIPIRLPEDHLQDIFVQQGMRVDIANTVMFSPYDMGQKRAQKGLASGTAASVARRQRDRLARTGRGM